MKKHLIAAALFWAALTAVGELLLFADLFPTVGSHEAEDFDEIFRILIGMGMPVFAFVLAVLGYSIFQFRRKGEPDEAGPMHRGRGAVPIAWLAITGTLAVGVMIFPGLTGLAKLQSDSGAYGWGATEGDLEIDVAASAFIFGFTYPEQNVSVLRPGEPILIPVDTRVKFNITSVDRLHSFWVPAFRLKIDAIPGRTTFITVEPTQLGDYETDDAYRVQCAELCGLDHATMFSPLKVVTQEEFEAWIAEQQAASVAVAGR
ncbi:MAG: cytochrome c oxidase subunit II [Dehalococcoidia bacterium]|nr:cytochrome c oxidase subunit II [Dehalococcoidia bacterium]